jgi:hypothetical protein
MVMQDVIDSIQELMIALFIHEELLRLQGFLLGSFFHREVFDLIDCKADGRSNIFLTHIG